jgi:hypothetical protein
MTTEHDVARRSVQIVEDLTRRVQLAFRGHVSASTARVLRSLAWATAVAFASSGVQAATLAGDTITVTLSDPASNPPASLFTNTALVGAGVDLTLGGVTSWDFNAGALGNEFVITVGGGSFPGFHGIGGTTTLTLSNLNFSGGEVLTGFSVISSLFPVTVGPLTATSVAFTFNEASFSGPVTFLDGDFITSPTVTVTPLPTALPLFATGLGALGLFGWRRKRKAQAVAA